MSFGSRKRNACLSVRSLLSCLLAGLLAFPPWAFADNISWNGAADGQTYGNR